MANNLINEVEKEGLKENAPQVAVGDLVVVHKTIVEGKKKRIQKFKGTIIKIQGSSVRKSFTVRKIVEGQGVEKSFLLHSPLVVEVDIVKLLNNSI